MYQIYCKNPINTVYLFKNIASFTISIPIRIVPKIKKYSPNGQKYCLEMSNSSKTPVFSACYFRESQVQKNKRNQ